jgi:hypothetical protein
MPEEMELPEPPARPPMTEAEAWRLAAAEGLSLVPGYSKGSQGDSRGFAKPDFEGVTRTSTNRTKAAIWHGGKLHNLGTFTNTPEAALAIARFLGPAGCAERCAAATASAPAAPPSLIEYDQLMSAKLGLPPLAPPPTTLAQPLIPASVVAPPMTEAEARRLAAAEGLALVPSDKFASGFKGVRRSPNAKNEPFLTHVYLDGKHQHLGSFTSAAEAALAYARHQGPASCNAAAAAPAPSQAVKAEEMPHMPADAQVKEEFEPLMPACRPGQAGVVPTMLEDVYVKLEAPIIGVKRARELPELRESRAET